MCFAPRLLTLRFCYNYVRRARKVWAIGNQIGVEFFPADVLSREDLMNIIEIG